MYLHVEGLQQQSDFVLKNEEGEIQEWVFTEFITKYSHISNFPLHNTTCTRQSCYKGFFYTKKSYYKGFFCTRHMRSYNKEFPSWNIITMKNYWRLLDTWESWVVTSYNMIKQRNIQIYISWQFLCNIVPPSKRDSNPYHWYTAAQIHLAY